MGEAVLSPLPKISYWFIHRRESFREALRLWDEYVTENLRQTHTKFVAKVEAEDLDLSDSSVCATENIAEMVYKAAEKGGGLADDEIKDEFLTILL
jgi:c-di-GMP-binding flagellar brake protein YcgR